MEPDEALETAYSPDDIEQTSVTPLISFDPHGRSHYTEDERRECVTAYLTSGSMSQASRDTGIPISTIQTWMRTDWWESVAINVRSMVTNQVRGKISACLIKGLDETLDRLNNGDEVSIKGEVRRVKMRGRDAAIVASIMSDKLAQSLNAPTLARVDGKVEVLADQLERLSAQVNARTINP